MNSTTLVIGCLHSALYAINYDLLHSGQHYDIRMREILLEELGIRIDIQLNYQNTNKSSSQLIQLMNLINDYLQKCNKNYHNAMVIVYVNTTLAGALVANKNKIKIIHIESGLRAGEWESEETNRKLITACSDFHFCPSRLSFQNLINENIPKDSIFFVGNTMAETFLDLQESRKKIDINNNFGISDKEYVLFTVHKEHNKDNYRNVINLLNSLTKREKVIFPVHPGIKK